ncbi:hypothetical protein BH10PSE4_BH10PSE4_16810 [soil metagenome]
MPIAQLVFPVTHRPEAKVLAAVIGVLQLTLIVLVWLLALVPATLLALTVMTAKAARDAVWPALSTANAP